MVPASVCAAAMAPPASLIEGAVELAAVADSAEPGLVLVVAVVCASVMAVAARASRLVMPVSKLALVSGLGSMRALAAAPAAREQAGEVQPAAPGLKAVAQPIAAPSAEVPEREEAPRLFLNMRSDSRWLRRPTHPPRSRSGTQSPGHWNCSNRLRRQSHMPQPR